MILSKDGIRFIKQGFEKFSPVPYDDNGDNPGGYPTIGWGHRILNRESFPKPLTEAQGDAIFLNDVANAVRTVNRAVHVSLSQAQFDALVSLCYNIGAAAFWDSTLLKLLNAKDYTGAANQFPLWRKSSGRVMNGLVRRREEERELFLTGDYTIRDHTRPQAGKQ
jgi:lysozyme